VHLAGSPFDSSKPGENSSSGRGRDDADSKFGEILGKFFGSSLPASSSRPRRRDKPSPMDRSHAEHVLRPSASPDVDGSLTDLRATGAFGGAGSTSQLSGGEGTPDDLLIAELRVAAAVARGETESRTSHTAEYVAAGLGATPPNLGGQAADATVPGSAASLHVLRYFFGDDAGVIAPADVFADESTVGVAQVVDDENEIADAVVVAEVPEPRADRTAFAPTVDFITAAHAGDSNTPQVRSLTPFPDFDASTSRVRVAASIASLLDSSPGGAARPSDSALLAAEVLSRSAPGEHRGRLDSGVVDLALRLTARLQSERQRGATLPLIPRDAMLPHPPAIEIVDQNAETTPPVGMPPVANPYLELIEGQTVVIDGDELMGQIAALNRHAPTPITGAMAIPEEALRPPEPPPQPAPPQRTNAATVVDLPMPHELLRANPDEFARLEPAPAPPARQRAPVPSSEAPGPILGTIMRKRGTGPLAPVGGAPKPQPQPVHRPHPQHRPQPQSHASSPPQPKSQPRPVFKNQRPAPPERPKPAVDALLRAYLKDDEK
jgi:hypothetical protein